MTKLSALPWALWRSQIKAVIRLEMKKTFFARRGLWVYILALMPVLLFGGHAIEEVMMRSRSRPCNLGEDSAIFASVFQFFFLRLAVFFGCVGIFMNLFRGEMLDKSLHFYLLAPVRREVLLVGKYLAGLIATVTIFTTSTALQLLALAWHFPSQVLDNYLYHAGGWSQVAAYLGVTALACLGYGSVFLAAGLFFRNPVIPTAVILLWESINWFLPAVLKKISIIFYLQSLSPVVATPDQENPLLRLLISTTAPTPAPLAVGGLVLLTAAVLVLASRRVRELEINYGAD